MSIPKIIHYCWVGGKPKPQSVLYCIESWKRCCPDYEIREWNESNYDFTKNEYMRQAYEAKKWGFVPDCARLDIVYEYGGIYLDTDVEMLRSFDELLEQDGFMGFENTGDGEYFVNCGHGFGAVPHHEVIRTARDLYNTISFLNADGTPNLLASPHFTTQALREFGLVQENRDQQLPGMTVYASDVLCPKNFRTGKTKKTPRTVSIHHFTASWVDEKIKEEMAHQQKIRNTFGTALGNKVLYTESVFQKYSVAKIPARVLQKAKAKLISAKDARPYYEGLRRAEAAKVGTAVPVILDTAMGSDNCGDQIIMEACMLQLRDKLDVSTMQHVPTHQFPSDSERKLLSNSRMKILCGTNILSGHMGNYGLWKLSPDVAPYRNTLLLGVGFDSTVPEFDDYTRRLFQTILSKEGIHSVRDSFSEKMLRDMGIQNVLNTGCPTMWGLTPEHCAAIPTQKAKNVVCTLTDYCRDEENDRAMLDILLVSYQTVYFWLQGRDDLEYIRSLGYENKVMLVQPDLQSFDAVLELPDLDYVGTRLHAGIRALNKGRRSLIASIDNRAECIHADTGLPIIHRKDISKKLKQRIMEEVHSKITIPKSNISQWMEQFN